MCPEAPATRGSYLSAGAALYGNTRAIRDTADMTLPPDLPGYALRVKTLAACCNGAAWPALRWLTPVRRQVYITPRKHLECRGKIGNGDAWMPGAMLTIKLLNSITNPKARRSAPRMW